MRQGFAQIILILVVVGAVGLTYLIINPTKKSVEEPAITQGTKTLHSNCKKYNFSKKEEFLPKYVVKKGDTLLSISRVQLGGNSRIGELIEMNKEFYPDLSIDKPFIEQDWILYLPPKDTNKTNGKLFEINGELSINPQDGRWGINYPNGGAGPLNVDEVIANENFKEGDCVKVVYEGETFKVFSASHQSPPLTSTSTPTPTPTSNLPTPIPRPATPPIPPVNIEDARTLYQGYVGIEPISLSEIKTKLEVQGCYTNDYKNEKNGQCVYLETEISQLKEKGIQIYPHGLGFGPISFYVTVNKLWADKDISGSPNPDKFKEAVRQDVKNIGNIVKIKENSWKITNTEYPWTAIY